MKAVNIKWDTDDNVLAQILMPEIEIPKEIEAIARKISSDDNSYDFNEIISDYLTEETGFCHFGFDLIAS